MGRGCWRRCLAAAFPGYNSVIGKDKATVGRILKNNGYATSWFGKNHNTPTFQCSQAGPFDQWPIGMGFDYFYGFMGGDTNQWQPNLTAGRSEFVYTKPMTGLPLGDSPSLLNCSYTVTAEITVPEGGAEGMIVTCGGRFAGYGFYLLKGKPVWTWNMLDMERVRWEGPEALAPGKHTLVFEFKYDGLGPGTLAFNDPSGIGRSGTGVLMVDGKEVATKKMERTLPIILQIDESFDIGSDTLTPVADQDYQCPFTLTARLDRLTIKIDRPKLSPEDVKRLKEAEAKAADAR